MITIFTPTYNRGYIIGKLYDSLRRQTNKNFEWLVVDDGSEDDTKKLFEKWVSEESSFPIRYYKQENGGKHRAVNKGLDLAQGEYFMVVDSDDHLTDNAIQKLHVWIKNIANEETIIGVVANKGITPLKTVNKFFREPYLDESLLSMDTYEEDGEKVLAGERAICFRTSVHRKYKYPEIDGEKFLTEAVVYNRMSNDGYKMRFYNDIIWIFEYLSDGLTSCGSDLYIKNPRGYGLWLREKSIFQHWTKAQKLRLYYTFTCDLWNRYDVNVICESMDVTKKTIYFMWFVHRIIVLLRKNKLK